MAAGVTDRLWEVADMVGVLEAWDLANIADFNSLIAQSQKYSTPVFALSDEQIEYAGKVLATMKKSRDDFATTFHSLANCVESITGA
jgi:chromosome partitioning protein